MSVIYMSCYADAEAMSCGMLGCSALQKPVTPEALAAKLAEILEAEFV
jgi:two-component SAPR family response regulator